MLTFDKKDWIAIPNILSLVRLLLIPLFSIIYLNATQPFHYYVAAVIILFSGLTDLLDGWIARKYHQITELGKILDPVADKLTQVVIVFCLLTKFKWMTLVAVIFLIKELFMLINSLVLLQKGKKLDGAKWYGKISTALFYICMILLIAFPTISNFIAGMLIMIIVFFLLLSLLLYGKTFKKMYRE
ncbi:CDP-alcohol phosphatidyltransferase family protein [Carnobacterium sp.]|uniref:CDP-alcohol phosphatidyltransferase family protein n=1 Tax=Carnobacterium sp. TaxID=48221 RepID=UPI003C7301FE